MDVSENRGTPKSSILIRFSIINHPFWGTLILGNTHIYNMFSLVHLKPLFVHVCFLEICVFSSCAEPIEYVLAFPSLVLWYL